VATDLLTGKSVWFQRGPIDAAIGASIAIPGVTAPHEIDGRLLADGGILDSLPMAPIAAVKADLTIAVSLNGSEPGATRDAEPGITTEWLNRMVRSTTALFDINAAKALLDRPTARAVLGRFGATIPESDGSDVERPAGDLADPATPAGSDVPPEIPKLGGFDVMNRTIDIAQSALARHTLAAYPPDRLIEVPRTTCRSLEFHRAVDVIAAGRQLAMRVLDDFDIDADFSDP
jgi:NTE family protein